MNTQEINASRLALVTLANAGFALSWHQEQARGRGRNEVPSPQAQARAKQLYAACQG